MAYFDCIVGGSGKGNTLVVTCADDLAGATITCTNGTKTYTKTCPSTSPYEVTFYGLEAGTWTVSATVSGNTYTTTVVITDYEAELGGFNWRTWVDLSKNYTSSDFTDLDDLLSDETAVRELMTIHACVDYLAGIAATSADVEKIIENDYCAKWINNRDYALDTLYANTIIKDYMDTADKYFYGEWVIVDDTTTPPTWGSKGNVPVMTSNTAPYGTASASNQNANAYQAFNGSDSGYNGGSSAYSGTITYAFTNPICPSKVSFRNNTNTDGNVRIYTYKVEGYDGTSWEDLTETLSVSDRVTVGALTEAEISTTKYYTQLRLNMLSGSQYIGCAHLQFYGRELSVSVPIMTNNTTPYGEALPQSDAYKAFDNSDSSYPSIDTSNGATGYIFTSKVKIKAIVSVENMAPSSTNNHHYLEYSDDGVNWTRLETDYVRTKAALASEMFEVIDETGGHKGWRWICGNTVGDFGSPRTLQFYGLDYSEREFEEGVTKKWLYDHGVELETLDSMILGNAGTVTKEPSEIKLLKTSATSSASTFVDIGTHSSIDLSNYSLLFAKLTGSLTAMGWSIAVLSQFPYPGGTWSGGTYDLAANSGQYLGPIGYLDVSNINQAAFPVIGSGYNTGTGYMEVKELWLE
jgi:hypothetical protein